MAFLLPGWQRIYPQLCIRLWPLAMSKVRYACCKHGPGHLRIRPRCGYGHRLNELRVPESISPRMWKDRTREPHGHAGIDWFFGQPYSPEQMERIVTLMANEDPDVWPCWVRMLASFLELMPARRFVSDDNFDWQENIRRILGSNMG